MTETKPTVALGAAVLDCLRNLPSKAAAKVSKFIARFHADPSGKGINYERIQNARDENLRSVRIDQDLRGIVLAPEKGNVYVLLWVAHHDDAYRWAQNRIARVNEATASLQVFSVSEKVDGNLPSKSVPIPKVGLFADLKDRQLTQLGVPRELFFAVRSIQKDTDLERIEPILPPDAYETLYLKAAGYTFEEVMSELDRKVESTQVAVDDFAAALKSSESQGRYWIADNEEDLQRMLDAPLEKWRVFLHPHQRKLIERDWNGPVRILGGAGTGKTVAAMHRARWLLTHRFTKPSEKILFTTFTTNLAMDLRDNLRSICNAEQMSRLEVVNLDSWVYAFLKTLDESRRIEFPGSTKLERIWDEAAAMTKTSLSTAFLKYEWASVVQPNSVSTREEYLRTFRIGRGTALGRKVKSQVWDVFEAYRSQLNASGLLEASDAYRLAREALANKANLLPYKSVIVDESQDMDSEAFRLLRAIVANGDETNSMFIVGDGHQRIYGRRAILGRCGINIRGRSRKLRINYRTSNEIRKWAISILEGVEIDDLDAGRDDAKGYRSLFHGPEPEIFIASNREQEFSHVHAWINKLTTQEGVEHKNICLMARSHASLYRIASALRKQNIKTLRLTRSKGENRQREGIRLSTMHRAKGLEFMAVALIAMNRGTVPSETALDSAPDDASKEETMLSERMLVHVAATRSKKWLLVTSSGTPSEFLMTK